MFHRTERLLLRPAWPEDWPAIKAGIADLAVLRNLASAPHPYQDKDAQRFASSEPPARFPRFLLTMAETAEVVGTIGIDPDPDGRTEMGYWVARQHWGNGFATEAGRAVLEMARILGHTQIAAAHFVDNPASGAVLRKIGFEPTGEIRERFSLGRGKAAPSVEYALDLPVMAEFAMATA